MALSPKPGMSHTLATSQQNASKLAWRPPEISMVSGVFAGQRTELPLLLKKPSFVTTPKLSKGFVSGTM